MDEAMRALDTVPDDVPGKRLVAAAVFGVCFLMAILVYFTPVRDDAEG